MTGLTHSCWTVLRPISETWSLAWKDLRHDARTSLVFLFTVAAIVAPLLLLFGLKNGVIETLRATLLKDPRNLEVVIYGSARLERKWFADVAARPDVAFLIPRTRTINASVDLLDAARRLLPTVEIIPTAAGDPLLPPGSPLPRHPGEVLITATLADKLATEQSSPLVAVIKRTLNGEPQHLRIPLTVVGVVPETRLARDALFTSLDFLVAAEDYRDGLQLDLMEGRIPESYATRRTRFANARLYAVELDQVASLAQDLRDQGIEVRTQAERISTVQAFDRTLSFVFRVIALISGAGCVLALGGALWVNVERKRRQLALLRLFGFGHGAVAAVPVIQGVVIAGLGFLLACLAYLLGAQAFDIVMGQNQAGGGYITRIDALDLAGASLLMLLVALIASLAGALRAGRVSPAEALRETIH